MDPLSFGASDETASPEPTVETEDYSLLPGFLKDIPEQDRAIVEKYTKPWDAGVTQKFQTIHNDYKTKLQPWESLGHSPEEVQAALEVVKTFNEYPGDAYRAMQTILQNELPELWEELNAGANNVTDYQEDPAGGQEEYGDDLPPALQQMIESLTGRLDQIDQRFTQQEQTATEEQQFAQFDAMMDNLHTRHGNFDDDWVTLQIMKGTDPEAAVKKYQEFESGIRNSQNTRPAPPIIGGQGGVPSDQVDTAKVRGGARQDLIANILAARQQG